MNLLSSAGCSLYRNAERAEIISGDALEVLAGFEAGRFKLVASSPPYNVGKSYEKRRPLQDYLDWQEQILAEVRRVLRDDGSAVWQVGNYVEKGEVFPLDMYFYPIFKKLGFKLRNRIIWHFEHGLHCANRFSGRYETLLWFTKTDRYTFNLDPVRVPSKYPGKLHYKGPNRGRPSGNPKGKNPSDCWSLLQSEYDLGVIDVPNVKSNHPEKTVHPCQFPIELMERCVLACTDEDDWVLDPFGGVGTTMIAAVKNGRNAVTVDLSREYSQEAERRLKALADGTLKFRPLGREIYRPSGREKAAQVPEEWKRQA